MDTTKHAWFGTYYHGTTPKAEREILRKGLLSRLGGTGATRAYGEVVKESPLGALLEPTANKFKKETAGHVSMSRSKLLSKIYGGILDPSTPSIMDDPRAFFKEAPLKILRNQPLEVKGIGSIPLKRDPSHPLLGVQTRENIPPKHISKSKPSEVIRKAIARASAVAPAARELGGSVLEAQPFVKFRPEGGRDMLEAMMRTTGRELEVPALSSAARAEAGPGVKRVGELIRRAKKPAASGLARLLKLIR